MFAAAREYVANLAAMPDSLEDAAIAMASELRANVRRRKRAGSKRRRQHAIDLRVSGYSARQARALAGSGRKTSGISIDGSAVPGAARVVASNEVQWLRVAQGETASLVELFRKHIRAIATYRGRRGRR